MTGPEHYRAAEHMLEEAQDPAEPKDRALLMAEAQVHATLAHAAATALGGTILGLPVNNQVASDWCAAIGIVAGEGPLRHDEMINDRLAEDGRWG